MKSFSPVRDTWRGTQSYIEKRRGRREIEMTRRRRGWNKRGENKLSSNHIPICSSQSVHLRDVHGVTQSREEGGRWQRWPGGEKGESKGERQIQPVISSLSVLHSPKHTMRFTELGREEKGREEIEVTWWRKRRVKWGREQSGQWSHSQVKMGTEDWVLKGTKLITNTKEQRLKI